MADTSSVRAEDLPLSEFRQIQCHRLAVHGLAVALSCGVDEIADALRGHIKPFETEAWPEGFVPARGSIRPFEEMDVLDNVSPTATSVKYPAAGPMEIYKDRERFWIVDERWGMADIDLVKREWRSWILPRPALDPVRCVEMAALWPMAQVLRWKALQMVPAVSVARDGWGALIIAPYGIEGELAALIREGYRVIGQRWTALREEDGRVGMLHMPGFVQRISGPRRKEAAAWSEQSIEWINLNEAFRGSFQNHAFCDAVLVATPGRRAQAELRAIVGPDAIHAVRRGWPIAELHPQRQRSAIVVSLAQQCRCGELQLSRNPADILPLLGAMRAGTDWQCAAPEARKRVEITLFSDETDESDTPDLIDAA